MRKRGRFGSLLCPIIAVAMAALIGAAGFGSAALAQQAQTAGPVSLGDLFVADSIDLKPGAADKLGEAAGRAIDPRADCPKEARFKVVVKQGDPLFQQALGTARRDVLKTVLLNVGASPRRFVVDDNVEVGGRVDDVRVDYQAIPDREKPKLDTNSVPPKGTKVKPGDKIEVTMVARDDANRWQSGIQSIQLLAESDGNRLVRAEGWRPQPRTCEHAPEPRRLVGTYEVPSNPPPVVRLRAIAEDFVNHHDTDIGEFPTGDWYGTIAKKTKGGGHNHTITVTFAFAVDTSGTIKGRANAGISTEEGEVPGCTMLWTYEPSEFAFPISGRLDGANFEIILEPPGTVTATITKVAGACKGGQESGTFTNPNPVSYATTKYRISAQEGATNAVNLSSGELPWGIIMRDSITIHQARQ